MSSDARDEGTRLLTAQRYEEAIAFFEKAVPAVTELGERAHLLALLSDAHRLAGTTAEAIRVADDALDLAKRAADEGAEAHAGIALGTALLEDFLEGSSSDNWVSRAMEALDRAAQIYLRLGQIDAFTALFTMAETAFYMDELDGAHSLYGKTIEGLTDDRWAKSASIAKHANYIRGRAYFGIGLIALRREDAERAEKYFETAVNMLLASDAVLAKPILEEIATRFEEDLGNPEDVAARIREAALRITA